MMGFNVIWLLTYLFHHSQKPPPNSFGCKPQAVKGMSKKKKRKRGRLQLYFPLKILEQTKFLGEWEMKTAQKCLSFSHSRAESSA